MTRPVRPETIAEQLSEVGHAQLGQLLQQSTIAELRALYGQPDAFRSRILMQQHGFGLGEYQYFKYPLPEPVAALRRDLYRTLVPIANDWDRMLGRPPRFPRTHRDLLAECKDRGQSRPTPLILKYKQGDYNCLHQDLYGEVVFPIQVVVLLSEHSEFDGGEFVFTEQRPRMQSRATVVPLKTGHGVAFAVNERPKLGQCGYYRVKHRHGVSVLQRGERYTLGIIFHDAA